jgi:hypothetical protein
MPNVLTRRLGTAPGYLFVTPNASGPSTQVGQTGPLIMDDAGNPIWELPVSNRVRVLDFQAQSLGGQPVLTWWQGAYAGPSGRLPVGTALPGSRFMVYNDHYQPIMSIAARNGFTADLHDLEITPQGNAVLIGTRVDRGDLSPYGGARNGAFVDAEIQEINLATGRLVFTWDLAQHVPLSDSFIAPPASATQAWDAYHVNSVDVSPDGTQLLISARSMSAVYDVSLETGQILWQLGGKQNQFKLPSSLITGPFNTIFQYQHDARFVPGGISLFDNGGAVPGPNGGPFGPGRGMIFNINPQNFTATLQRPPLYHDPVLNPNSQGDLQVLPNGNALIGWGMDVSPGSAPNSSYSEYSANGTLLYDAVLPGQDVSYRVFRQPWVGLPLTRPSAAVVPGAGEATVFASWNGSTETTAWQLLAGPNSRSLAPVSVTPRTGFETAIATTNAGPFYEVQALSAAGTVLNTSLPVRARGPRVR